MATGERTSGGNLAENRRRWVRHKADVPVKVLVAEKDDTLEIDGRCLQISAGGMCLFAVGNLTPGTQISLEFVDPHSGKADRVQGTVRNRVVYLYGVEYERAKEISNLD
jgi:c-di-GMP-binding flagellar brake protein YcgR